MRERRDLLPVVLLSLGMAALVRPVSLLGLGDLPTLLIQIPLGIALYVGGSLLFKLDSFTMILNLLRSFLRGKKEAT